MREEIWNQKEDLPLFASRLRKSHSEIHDPTKLVFVGSGDSYAVSIFAQELSEGQSIAFDPYQLSRNITRIRNKTLVITSVSGRTQANVDLAKKARRYARKTIAVTANDQSPLARACDETLPLRYRSPRILTSGTISFTSSLIACAFLLGKLPGKVDVSTSLKRGASWAKNTRIGSGSFFFVGSSVNYALARFGAAKIQEVIGVKADADYSEQLGHARLFTIDRRSDNIVCVSTDGDRVKELERILSRTGFRTELLKVAGRNGLDSTLEAAIHLQQLALRQAETRGMKEYAFLLDRRRLILSNQLIY